LRALCDGKIRLQLKVYFIYLLLSRFVIKMIYGLPKCHVRHNLITRVLLNITYFLSRSGMGHNLLQARNVICWHRSVCGEFAAWRLPPLHLFSCRNKWRTMYYESNNMALSRNHFCRAKSRSVTYSECVSVDLGIQHVTQGLPNCHLWPVRSYNIY